MNGHKLDITQIHNEYRGVCECTDPDYSDGGWSGVEEYFAPTHQDIVDMHHDHLVEVEDTE